MTTKTKQLAALIDLALQKNTGIPVTASELLAAIKAIENELETLSLFHANGQALKENLQQMLLTLSTLLFALQNKVINHLTQEKHLLLQTEMVYEKIVQTLKWYCYIPDEYGQKLLPVKKLVAQLSVIDKNLQENAGLHELYPLLQPEIAGVLATKKLPCHRWVWWSKYCAAIAGTGFTDAGCLQDMLIKLNYNTPAFIHWLVKQLQDAIETQHSVSQKQSYLVEQLLQYELLPCADNGYMPAEKSVQQVITNVLQKKYRLLQNAPALSVQHAATQVSKLNTTLSVPQLALFIRLMVDTKVINENNNLSLLRSVAAIVSTGKAASLSPDSLKVNYYTPGSAAKNIVKDYLLNMVSLLRNY